MSGRIEGSLRRAALYIRVSTEEQAKHGLSLDAQREKLTQYAKENNLDIVDYYEDEGATARKKLSNRKEFARMMQDVEANKIDVILFIKLDRWFRNVADYYSVQAILDEHEVQWIATEEEYDTTTANGRLHLNIKLAIAQDESDRTSERIKFVFENRVKEGKVISGKASVGYKIVNQRWEIDEGEAPIVQDLFTQIIEQRSSTAAQRYILEKYGKFIGLKELKHIATNERYLGRAYGIEGWCPRLIDDDTFRKAQDLIKIRSQRNSYERTDRVYLFSGLLFCPECGSRLTVNYNKGFIYYRCPFHTSGRCSNKKFISQTVLEHKLLTSITTIIDGYNLKIKEGGTLRKSAIKSAEKTREKLLRKIDRLKDLYLDDLISKEAYKSDYEKLNNELAEVERQIAAEGAENEKKPVDLTACKHALDAYNLLDDEHKKAFWSSLIRSITIATYDDFYIDFY